MTVDELSEQSDLGDAKGDGIKARFEQWKRRLLDLSRANPLLYFGRTRGTRVQITKPGFLELFRQLVEQGSSLTFPEPVDEPLFALLAEPGLGSTGSRELPVRKGSLETSLEVSLLQRSLHRLRNRSRESMEEQGINTLYLAVGLLEWRESNSATETVRSPLILVPVLLTHERNKPFALQMFEDEILLNPTLSYVLERDFNFQLPSLDDPNSLNADSLASFLDEVELAIHKKGWQFLKETWLGIFAFESLVLYRDLADHSRAVSEHPLVRAIAGVNPPPDIPDPQNLDRLDEAVPPAEVFPVLDADDSQLQVILRVRAGQSLVIHGPPGTGKSQTIANLIAQSLRDGKTVLFVSQKMAALEVVYDRLAGVGLGDLCLQVHSHRADKKAVIDQLARSLNSGPAASVSAVGEFERLRGLRERLNAYGRVLRAPLDAQKRSPCDIYGLLARLASVPDVRPPILPNDVLELTETQEEAIHSAVRGVAEIGHVFDSLNTHPWRDAITAQVTPTFRNGIADALQGLRATMDSLRNAWQNLEQLVGLPFPSTAEELLQSIEVVRHLTNTPNIPASAAALQAAELRKTITQLGRCLSEYEVFAQARGEYKQVFDDRLLEFPVLEQANRFTREYRSWWRRLSSTYHADMSLLGTITLENRKLDYATAERCLAAAAKSLELQERLELDARALKSSLDSLIDNGVESDWVGARDATEWLLQFMGFLGQSNLPTYIRDSLASSPVKVRESALQYLARAEEDLVRLEAALAFLSNSVFPNGSGGRMLRQTSWADLSTQADRWLDNISGLNDWADFLRASRRCEDLNLGSFLDDARIRGVTASQLDRALSKALATAWISAAYECTPVLGEFNLNRFEQLIAEFRQLDAGLRKTATKLVLERATMRRPLPGQAAARESEVGVLRREATKTRRHKPLRRLFPEIRGLLFALKPCLLMSPLSVASYIPPGLFTFDIVIFDEASQIPPEQAIGAISRGKQIVVAGDEKQLPPTNFFKALVEEDSDEEDEGSVELPMPSILEECIPLLRESWLRWHYRSKHESLIGFSNHEFYDGRLVTFPAPSLGTSCSGVKAVIVPDGVFDTGKSRTNRKEALLVAQMVIQHMREFPERSLGVITMSLSQKEAIEQELGRLRLSNPDLDGAFAEDKQDRFFIKNLEVIQGHERDSVLISLGYGPDENGVPHLRFGPLSQAGGERRLNVAVTRGKIQTTIVSSLTPDRLDLSRLTTQSEGVKKLQRYLTYAVNGGRFSVEPAAVLGDPESPFEDAVLDALRKSNLRVDSQVGASDFRIDIAVRHPDSPGRYILGIECDGATYHRTASARERDRLRQEVLESLGWKITRIWSPDWVQDPKRAVQRILSLVEELRQTEAGIPAATLASRSNQLESDGDPRALFDEQLVHPGPYAIDCSPPPPTEWFRPYKEYRFKGWRQMANLRMFSDDAFIDDVINIVQMESPVHISAVAHRIAQSYRVARVGRIIDDKLRRAITMAVHSKRVLEKDDFLFAPDQREIVPRGPNGDGKPRIVEEIAFEEIAAGVESVLRAQLGMPRDSLIRETARRFGFHRAGSRVSYRIGQTISSLVENGLLRDNGSTVSFL